MKPLLSHTLIFTLLIAGVSAQDLAKPVGSVTSPGSRGESATGIDGTAGNLESFLNVAVPLKGGPFLILGDVVRYISIELEKKGKGVPNFIYADEEVDEIHVQNFEGKDVTVRNIFTLLERLYPVKFEVIDEQPDDGIEGFVLISAEPVPQLLQAEPVPRLLRVGQQAGVSLVRPATPQMILRDEPLLTTVFALDVLLDAGLKTSDISDAILSTWEMGGFKAESKDGPALKFHDATSTLIVRGTKDQTEQAQQMIQILLQRTGELGESGDLGLPGRGGVATKPKLTPKR